MLVERALLIAGEDFGGRFTWSGAGYMYPSALSSAQEAGMAFELLEQYPPGLPSPAAARSGLAAYLVRLGHRELIPVAVLLVSELVTNSIVHASGPVTVWAAWADDRLRVDVSDHGGGTPAVRDSEESGRGLHILDALATRWGVRRCNGAGRATWFELRSS